MADDMSDILQSFVGDECSMCDRNVKQFKEDLRSCTVNRIATDAALAADTNHPLACPAVMSLAYSVERRAFEDATSITDYVKKLEEGIIYARSTVIGHTCYIHAKLNAGFDEQFRGGRRESEMNEITEKWSVTNLVAGKKWRYDVEGDSNDRSNKTCEYCHSDRRRITDELRGCSVNRIIEAGALAADFNNPIACTSVLSRSYALEREAFEEATSAPDYVVRMKDCIQEMQIEMLRDICKCRLHGALTDVQRRAEILEKWHVRKILRGIVTKSDTSANRIFTKPMPSNLKKRKRKPSLLRSVLDPALKKFKKG